MMYCTYLRFLGTLKLNVFISCLLKINVFKIGNRTLQEDKSNEPNLVDIINDVRFLLSNIYQLDIRLAGSVIG